MTDPTVVLCTVTYRRPHGLAQLLERVARIDTGGTDVRLVVVDNDATHGAEAVVIAATESHPFRIDYVVEPRRGITYARNAALAAAMATQPDWIGWIDDDEAPHDDWLVRLLATQAATDADVVIGPSNPVFEPDARRWIVEAGLFDSDHFTTGESYPYFHTRTSGVIVRASVIPPEGFDDRLALTGGEDRVFFTRIHRSGGTFAWDDLAIVDEWVPTSRVSPGWLARRWFRTGVTRSLTLLILDEPSVARRARRVLGGLAMATSGAWRLVLASRGGRRTLLPALRPVLLGLGASYGAFGLQYREYRTIHGQ